MSFVYVIHKHCVQSRYSIERYVDVFGRAMFRKSKRVAEATEQSKKTDDRRGGRKRPTKKLCYSNWYSAESEDGIALGKEFYKKSPVKIICLWFSIFDMVPPNSLFSLSLSPNVLFQLAAFVHSSLARYGSRVGRRVWSTSLWRWVSLRVCTAHAKEQSRLANRRRHFITS